MLGVVLCSIGEAARRRVCTIYIDANNIGGTLDGTSHQNSKTAVNYFILYLRMGVCLYSIGSYSAYGILVSWKDVLAHLGIEELPVAVKNDQGQKIRFPTSEIRAALKEHQEALFSEYNVYTVGNSFLLFSPETITRNHRVLRLVGSYCNNTRKVSIRVLPHKSIYDDEALMKVAKMLSAENEPKFIPGLVSITSSTHRFSLRLVFRRREPTTREDDALLDSRIPTDVCFKLGTETLHHNQAVLTHFGLESLLVWKDATNTVDFEQSSSAGFFSMNTLKKQIRKSTTRSVHTNSKKEKSEEEHSEAEKSEAEKSFDSSSDYQDSEGEDLDIQDMADMDSSDLGTPIEDVNTDGYEYSMQHMPCYFDLEAIVAASYDSSTTDVPNDCTFLVGLEQELVEANRAVLAHSNEVLANMLYGTGLLQVDPSVPIKWTEFEPEAVRLAFAAITGKTPTVPNGMESMFHAVLDFLGETTETVTVLYDRSAGTMLDEVVLDYDAASNEWMVGEDGDY